MLVILHGAPVAAPSETMLDEDIHLTDADGADEAYLAAPYNTLVSYVVAPFMPSEGSYSYQPLSAHRDCSVY